MPRGDSFRALPADRSRRGYDTLSYYVFPPIQDEVVAWLSRT